MKYAHLRCYTINKGQIDSWLSLFQEIIPVMSEAGIKVESYWVNEEKTQFIWIRSYGNEKESIAVAENFFYGSEWWKENVDIVRGHIAHREFKIINSV